MKELLDGFSVERLEHIAALAERCGQDQIVGFAAKEVSAMARIVLAVKQPEPVAYTSVDALADVSCELTGMMGPKNVVGNVPLFTTFQPGSGE